MLICKEFIVAILNELTDISDISVLITNVVDITNRSSLGFSVIFKNEPKPLEN